MVEDLKAFWKELKAKNHNLKWYLYRWNFEVFELLFTYIDLSLVCLSVLFKHKSLSFVNLSLFLHNVSILWSEHLYIMPNFQRPVLKVHVLWCTGIYSRNLSEKVSLMYEDSFPIPLLCNLMYISLYFIHTSMKTPASSWSSFRANHVSYNWSQVFWACQ